MADSTFFEFVIFCILVVIVFLLNKFYGKIGSQLSNNQDELEALRRDISDLKHLLDKKAPAESIHSRYTAEPEISTAAIVQSPEPPKQETFVESLLKEQTPAPEPKTDSKPLTVADINAAFSRNAESEPEPEKESEVVTTIVEEVISDNKQEHQPAESFMPKWDKEIDYEKYIGENLISKIGIAILVLAIGFFVKYAIDNNWIGPVGRVCVGLVCGGILVGLAHKLRKDYKAFSSVLVGGGLAVFYFTIALAYHQFHLFDQNTSFAIMVVITIFAVVLSLLYDRQELAVISMVGGYATPFMVSNGSGNYIALFTYLSLLNTGLLVIAYMRIWRILNLLAFVFTVIIYSSWLFTLQQPVVASIWQNAFLFATLFFLFFFTACLAHNIKEKKKFLPFDFSMLLVNSLWYLSIGLYLIDQLHAGEYKGLFSAAMAAFHLVVSFILYRNQKADSNILYLLIGITLSFISITAPLQLEGSYITLFWASESVLLFWLYQRSNIRIIAIGSTLVWCVTALSLLAIWTDTYLAYDQPLMTIIFNKAFITSIYTALCSAFIYYLHSRNESEETPSLGLPFLLPKNLFLIAAVFILFITGSLEIYYQFDSRLKGTSVSTVYLMLYLQVFAYTALTLIKRYTRLPIGPVVESLLLGLLIGIYIIHLPVAYDVYTSLLTLSKFSAYYSAHWVSAVLAALLIWKLIENVRLIPDALQSNRKMQAWGIGTVIVIFLSTEFYLAAIGLFYDGEPSIDVTTRVYIKAVLPILWGICSFAFMWVGMKFEFRALRILSLVLFSLTLLKLFLFDISNVPIAGKIAAFFCLGVMLLVVSFMYQRLKKILIEDGEKKQD